MSGESHSTKKSKLNLEGIYSKELSDSELVERFRPLVAKIARLISEHLLPNVPLEDLLSLGYIGLIEAHKRFDDTYRVRFSTFAYYRIRGSILDGCRRSGWPLRKGVTLQELRYLNEYYESELLANSDCQEPRTFEDCSDYLADAVSNSAVIVTLLREQRERVHEDPPQHKRLCRRQTEQLLHSYLDRLAPNEQYLIKRYYYDEVPMETIAEELGVSRSWVSRIHARTVQRLRQMIDAGDGKEAFNL